MAEYNEHWSTAEHFDEALVRFRAIIGDEAAARIEARRDAATDADALAAIEVPFAMTWGWLLGRPVLSLRERALALLTVDVSTRSWRAFGDHLKLARSAGLSLSDIDELLLQVGPYCGFPAIVEARALMTSERSDSEADGVPSTTILGGVGSDTASDWGWLGRGVSMLRVRVVVPDLDDAIRSYAELLGLSTWLVNTVDATACRVSLDGQSFDAGFRSARLANPRGIDFELIQPTTGATTFARRLATNGASVHDVCIVSCDAQGTAEFISHVQKSARIRQSVTVSDATTFWIDTTEALGGYYLSVGSLEAWDRALGVPEVVELGDLSDPELDFSNEFVQHLGVVVADVERRTRDYAATFGQKEWPVINLSTESGTLVEVAYNGQKGPDAYLSSSAPVGQIRQVQPIGGTAASRTQGPPLTFGVELIQPLSGPSRYREGYHDRFGDGVQHVYFGPVPDDETWNRLRAAFERHGISTVTLGSAFEGAVDYAYFGTLERLGFDIEVFRHHRAVDRAEVSAYTMVHP